jgi:hypothetical protein
MSANQRTSGGRKHGIVRRSLQVLNDCFVADDALQARLIHIAIDRNEALDLQAPSAASTHEPSRRAFRQ